MVAGGRPLILRERSGDYIRDLLSEASGFDQDPEALDGSGFATCSRDSCVATLDRDGRRWLLLATRSSTWIDWPILVEACARADIVVSDRWLPRGCVPKWLKLDRRSLEQTGGVASTFAASRGWKPSRSG
jgi:competence protein ComEC